jgi:long-chain acyl-CoA synthetase
LSFKDNDEMCKNDAVKKQVMKEVEHYSKDWKGFEKVQKITLTAEDFTTANNMLTPSLKVKRRFVWQKYSAQIEALYADGQKAKAAN